MRTIDYIKWGIPFLIIMLIGLAVLGKKTFHTEIVVPFPPEDVWSVLMDTQRYGEWNPVAIKVDGEYKLGNQVKSQFVDPEGSILNITSTVKTFKPMKEIRQTGGLLGFLTFNHSWKLVPIEEDTLVIQHEVDQGLYMWFWDSSWIEPSYTKVNLALKDRLLELRDLRKE